MGNNRPVKTKDWVAFLLAHDCKYQRTKASHVHYNKKCLKKKTKKKKKIKFFLLTKNKSLNFW